MRSAVLSLVKPMSRCALFALTLVLSTAVLPVGTSAQKPSKPLGKDQIIDLLKNSVPPSRVETLAKQYGISF